MIEGDSTIHRLILSSSRAVYGEGKYYSNERGVEVYPDSRKMEQLAIGDWNIYEGTSVAPLSAMATDENSKISPQSAYALTKAFQEAMVENFCKTRNISYVVLRYFNVYGQRQSLCNPYIGVASIFCTRLINRNPVVLYEDGTPIRDFVHVKDVVTANLLALNPKVTNEVFNVGSGQPLSLYDVGVCLVREFGLDEDKFLKRSKMYRIGDIRSCYANIQKIQTRLQYFPTVTFSDGARELINWVIDESKRQTVQDQHSAVEQLMVQKKILLKSSN
jgi:dTDP-L-rhamnose 4-epimerase